ncbi:MAG: hypothetical protein H7Z16_15215 [Pyrinomonadaceae bacterium]|nr:hypothetical protein [Pyrinomonadaceae bacterium]
MKTLPNLRRFLQSEFALRSLQLCVGAIAIGLIFWKLQYSTQAICCGDFDGYYHIKWSRMLWESLRHGGFPPQFTWLPLTTLDPKNYVDHHLLFHVFQIPFTWFGDLRVGAKISATIFGSVAVFSCYWLLVRYRIRYPLVWLLALLACSAPFLYRLSMAKAPPFAIIYLVIGIYFLFTRKYWPLVPLAFIFALTYDMFVLLILASFIWTAVIGWTERRFEWRPIAWVLAGTVAGLVINPYFPTNLQLFYEHLRIKITASDFSTKVGNEWYPYDSWEFIGNTLLACVAMFVGYLSFDPSDRKRSQHSLFFLVLATVLMIMTARWRRIAEYWPPFAVMFAAFALQARLMGTRSMLKRSLDTPKQLELLPDPPPSVFTKEVELKEVLQTMGVAVIAVLIAVVLFFNVQAMSKDIATSARHETYKAGAEWMRANVPAGERVFNTDWDDFPRLFYYDPAHNYVSGLDPTYLYDRDKELSELYDSITLGKEEDPGPLIRDRFGARYVFSDNSDHDDFFFKARESGWFDIVYEDRDCTILYIRDQKQEPEAEEPDTGEAERSEPQQDNR